MRCGCSGCMSLCDSGIDCLYNLLLNRTMKRIITLTLFLLFYSLPLSASLNGKGLVCECIETKRCSSLFSKRIHGQLFENDKTVSFSYWITKDKVDLIIGNPQNYTTSVATIDWGEANKKDPMAMYSSLNRQTLILNSVFVTSTKFKCEVYQKKDYIKKMYEWRNIFQEENDDKHKDNKI